MRKRLFLPICFLLVVGAGVTASAADDPHLMVWYKLDETEGGTARDDSMYGRDAVVDGPGDLGVWNPGDGQFGGSLIFNDNTDVEVPAGALSTISTGITVSVWLKDSSRPGSNNWVFGTGSGNIQVRAAVVASNGNVQWRAGNSSNDQLSWDLDGIDHTTLQGWHHWVFVKDEVNGIISIYLDGILAASKTGIDSTLVNVPGSQLRFGTGSGHANDFIGKMDDIRVYDRALAAHEVGWLYTGVLETASALDPQDKAEDIRRDVTLSWIPGIYADKHDVYFGTVFNNVNDAGRVNPLGVLASQSQDANTYAPGLLEYRQTYYWRIDEVNNADPASPWKGAVWSFTVEPYSYVMDNANILATASSSASDNTGPQKTVDGSGLNSSDLHSIDAKDMWISDVAGPQPTWIRYEFDGIYTLHEMWVWNQNQVVEGSIGFGAKDVTIEYSTDGVDWLALGDFEFAQAPGLDDYSHNTTVDFGGVPAKYVRLIVNSNWGAIVPQYGLSEVRFMYIPTYAREPKPVSGATDVNVDVVLSWRAGREAAEHHLYLSSDEQAVIDGNTPVSTVTEASYGPLSLDLGTTYYWKINEVNEAETTTTWQSEIWNFTTHEFFVVDDFEDYNDYPPDEIWSTWVDGYGVPTNGATVGYPAPDFLAGENYAETTIVHGGDQAMPFFYDNTGTATYSEGERTFAVPQDWTKHGITTLSMAFCGDPNNAVEQMYVKVNGSKVVYGGDAGDMQRGWYEQWNIDLASFGASLQNVTKLSIGVGDETSTTPGGSGVVYFDDIRLYRSVSEPSEGIWIEAELADVIGASWRIYDDPASSGGRHIGSEDGDGSDGDTAPGAEWVAVYNFDAAGGTYKVLLRAQEFGSDSFWVRIPGATSQTHEDPGQPGTGWVRFNGVDAPDGWAWDEVHSDDHDREIVNWTLPAGPHTLEIAKREDGVLLDAIVITDDVD